MQGQEGGHEILRVFVARYPSSNIGMWGETTLYIGLFHSNSVKIGASSFF